MPTEENINAPVANPDDSIPTSIDAKIETGAPLTSRELAQPRPMVVAEPPAIDNSKQEVQVITGVRLNEDEEFMKTATPEELDRIRKMSEKDILSSAVIAVDLRLPNAMNAKPKDPIWVFFWGNRKYDGPGGNRYEQLKAIGFMNAHPDDVLGGINEMLRYQDGGIIYQDAILLKIRKDRWLGYQKANILKANQLHNKNNIYKEAKKAAQEELNRSLSAAGVAGSPYAAKLRLFDPQTESPRPFD